MLERQKIIELKKMLAIFKTEKDKYGRDITVMSDFFEGYVQQMTSELREQSNCEILQDIPISDLGMINEVINQASMILKGNVAYNFNLKKIFNIIAC